MKSSVGEVVIGAVRGIRGRREESVQEREGGEGGGGEEGVGAGVASEAQALVFKVAGRRGGCSVCGGGDRVVVVGGEAEGIVSVVHLRVLWGGGAQLGLLRSWILCSLWGAVVVVFGTEIFGDFGDDRLRCVPVTPLSPNTPPSLPHPSSQTLPPMAATAMPPVMTTVSTQAAAKPALGARKAVGGAPIRGAGRKVVAASARRVAAVTSAEYKVRQLPDAHLDAPRDAIAGSARSLRHA